MASDESGSDSSLFLRFFRRFFESGTPVGPSEFVSLDPPSGKGMPFCILTRTERDRLVFWHPLPRDAFMLSDDGTKGIVDHITLELSSGKSHLTTTVSDKKRCHPQVQWRLFPFENTGLAFWFRMLYPLRVLENQDLQVKRRVPTPPSDNERRKDELAKAAGKMTVHPVKLPQPIQGDYLVAAVLVETGEVDRPRLSPQMVATALDVNGEAVKCPEMFECNARSARIRVGDSRVVIVLSCPPGSIGDEPRIGTPSVM